VDLQFHEILTGERSRREKVDGKRVVDPLVSLWIADPTAYEVSLDGLGPRPAGLETSPRDVMRAGA
jgi:hypothetical protein